MVSALRHYGSAIMLHNDSQRAGFTLVELLVVVAIIALLVSILLPSLSTAKEMARVVKVRAELAGIGTALELFAEGHDGRYPPVRCYCNPDVAKHTHKLPIELGADGYLPKSNQVGMETNAEDIFNPGHTYKYKAPGDMCFNDSRPVPKSFDVRVPKDFPYDPIDKGLMENDDLVSYYDPATSPVLWVVYSLGPDPTDEKVVNPRAPIARNTWYGRVRDTGVIMRIKSTHGMFNSQP